MLAGTRLPQDRGPRSGAEVGEGPRRWSSVTTRSSAREEPVITPTVHGHGPHAHMDHMPIEEKEQVGLVKPTGA